MWKTSETTTVYKDMGKTRKMRITYHDGNIYIGEYPDTWFNLVAFFAEVTV